VPCPLFVQGSFDKRFIVVIVVIPIHASPQRVPQFLCRQTLQEVAATVARIARDPFIVDPVASSPLCVPV
jgi:hypothetical protein